MSSYPTFKAAAVQASPVLLDLDATVAKTVALVDEAAAAGAKVIAFPEAFIPGYPWWIWMGAADYGMKYYIDLYKNAVEIPSRAVSALSDAARRNRVYFCVSVTEKDGAANTPSMLPGPPIPGTWSRSASLYLAQLWFGPDGSLLGKHRKLKATNAEKTIWGDGDGSLMPVFETEVGRLGGLQCWEHYLPLNLAAMAAQNEQVHVSSWPIAMPVEEHLFGRSQCLAAARYYAISNQVFCLVSSMIWTDEQADRVCETDAQRQVMKNGYGFSAILAPNGLEIGNPLPHDVEGITYADIDLEQIIPGRFLIDTAGHYSTPGYLSLHFDRSVHTPVRMTGTPQDASMSYEDLHPKG